MTVNYRYDFEVGDAVYFKPEYLKPNEEPRQATGGVVPASDSLLDLLLKPNCRSI